MLRCDQLHAYLDELQEVLALWSRSHQGLQHGDADTSLPGTNSREVTALFVQIEPHYQAMRDAAEGLLTAVERAAQGNLDDAAAQPYTSAILDHEPSFLAGMNDIVFQYDAEAQARVNRLKRMELVLMSIVLLVLLLEALLVFAPAVRVIRRQFTQVRESEARLSTTLKSIGDAVIATDMGGSVRFMNPVAEVLTGWKEDDATGKPLTKVFAIIDERTGQRAKNPITRVLAEGVIVGLAKDTALLSKDGTKRAIDDSAAPLKDEEGRVSGAVLTFRDVTEHKRAEDALRFQNRVFRDLHGIAVSESSDVVAFCDRVVSVLAGIFNVSDAIIEWTTPTGIEVVSMWTQGEIVHGGRYPLAGTPCENVYHDHTVCHYQGPLKDLFPEDAFFLDHPMQAYAGAPLLDPDRNVLGILNVMNVDERPFSGEELQVLQIFAQFVGSFVQRKRTEEKNQRLALAVNSAAEAIVLTDKEGRIIQVNPAFSEITGYTIGKALAQTPRVLKSGKHPPEFYETMWKTITAGQVWSGRVINKRKDGSFYHAALTIAPVREEGGEVAGYVGVQRDVTEDIEREEALAEALNQAEACNRAKSEFLANMSHEIRTPLHGILSFARFGIDKALTADSQKLLDYFQKIDLSGKRLMALLSDVLDLAKMEAGKMRFEFTPTDLRTVVRSVENEFRSLLAQRNIRIDYTEPDSEVRLALDENRMGQVVRNLLGNAAKFSPEGGTIWMKVNRSDAGVGISVRDNGVGIPEEELETIFGKFVQSSKTSSGAGGTGLGLSICREIVEAHQGRIWAENHPQGGAVFHVLLPLTMEPGTPGEEDPAPALGARISGAYSRAVT